MIRASVLGASLVLCGGSRLARAEVVQLSSAREAIDAVRYDDARDLLIAALASGALAATETADAYRLLGTTLIVLGKAEDGEQAYRRWLAIDPAGELPTSASAKLQRPFQAARAYITEHGALRVTARRSGGAVEVTLDADPLAMAASVTLDGGPPSTFGEQRSLSLAVAADRLARVAVRDDKGNVLVDIAVPVAGGAISSGPRVTIEQPIDQPPATPIWRRWPVWAVSAVVLGGAGAYFAYDAVDARDRLAAIAGTHGEFFASDVDSARGRLHRDRIAAGLLFGAGAASAITAVVMVLIRPQRTTNVTPIATPSGGGVMLQAQF